MLEKLAEYIRKKNATILMQDVFTAPQIFPDDIGSLEKAFGEVRWPVAWIGCRDNHGDRFVSSHTPVPGWRIRLINS